VVLGENLSKIKNHYYDFFENKENVLLNSVYFFSYGCEKNEKLTNAIKRLCFFINIFADFLKENSAKVLCERDFPRKLHILYSFDTLKKIKIYFRSLKALNHEF
jgi:hypothetical protein